MSFILLFTWSGWICKGDHSRIKPAQMILVSPSPHDLGLGIGNWGLGGLDNSLVSCKTWDTICSISYILTQFIQASD